MFYYQLDAHTTLKPLTRRYSKQLFELIHANRPHLRAWMPWVDTTDSVEALSDFVGSAERQLANDDGFHALILVDGNVAGVAGFHAIDWSNRTTSIGYWLGTDYTGRGIMTRVCGALLHYALCERQLERVEILCGEGNVKSRAIVERLGFIEEGTRRRAERLYGRQINLVVYGMTAADWRCDVPGHERTKSRKSRREG